MTKPPRNLFLLWLSFGWFLLLSRVPIGPHWPLWWSRLWERIAIATTPQDGY